MDELPSGTLSMLFSDIEGSTMLLSRLGPSYLEALDGHRRVMRDAWTAHGGTEMGTEGDSFFVVFPTAGAAVQAAVEAQRGLAAHRWPEGEGLRVRIGVHTGTPQVHEGDYWGMDVHRAARIAGSAHGGQVVVSAVTAELGRGELPEGVALRDLGLHHLKDIPDAEHLYQLDLEGLPSDFPALRTVGTSSSLPHPATQLIGREDHVAELTALLRSREARLVTLTGAGGSGKTRLAIAVAEHLVPFFPSGVFFVPMSAVTTAEVMWTSIAEVLDLPPRERVPERFLAAVSRRSLLLVLDNLEQVEGADEVVSQLLAAAPELAVIATSRRPLGLVEERRHPVPPLACPDRVTVAAAEGSAAVHLFVLRARSVRPDFRLTPDNVDDVVSICRRLDGLPLAVELCAARIRLLSPQALLARLHDALDIASTSGVTPLRQRTLRETISWSHALLSPAQQAFFRRLAVLAGGGDLRAVAAVAVPGAEAGAGVGDVTRPVPVEADPLDTVAELADASLLEIGQGPDGEPRVTLLETIRAFGTDELRAVGELADARRRHAQHYADLAERLQALRTSRHLAALDAAELELDNFREALATATVTGGADAAGAAASAVRGDAGAVAAQATDQATDLAAGLRLCAALGWLWGMAGYLTEGRQWHERLLARTDGSASPQLASCIAGLASILLTQGEPERARELADRSLAMARSVDDPEATAFALGVLGTAQLHLGDVHAARENLRATIQALRPGGDHGRLGRALGNLGGIEEALGHVDRAEALIREALEILDAVGDVHEAAIQRQNLANLLTVAGRVTEAEDVARGLVSTVVRLRSPGLTMAFANTYMNILLRTGRPVLAAELFGAEEEMHARLSMPNPFHDEELEEAIALVADEMSAEEWDRHRRAGNRLPVEDLLARLGSDHGSDVDLSAATPGESTYD